MECPAGVSPKVRRSKVGESYAPRMDDMPVFRMTIIAAYDWRDAEREARARHLRRSEWIYAGNGESTRGYSPECPLVVTEMFCRRRDIAAVSEELRFWKRMDDFMVDAPTQSG